MVLPAVDPLEVLRYGLVHLVTVADELVLHYDRPQDGVAALHSEDLFRRGVESLQVVRSKEGEELIQDVVVV